MNSSFDGKYKRSWSSALIRVLVLVLVGWYGFYLSNTTKVYPENDNLQHGIYQIATIKQVSKGYSIFREEYREFCFEENMICFQYSLKYPFFTKIFKVGNRIEIWFDDNTPPSIRQIQYEKQVVLSYSMAKWYITNSNSFFSVILYFLVFLWILVLINNLMELWKLFMEKYYLHNTYEPYSSQ